MRATWTRPAMALAGFALVMTVAACGDDAATTTEPVPTDAVTTTSSTTVAPTTTTTTTVVPDTTSDPGRLRVAPVLAIDAAGEVTELGPAILDATGVESAEPWFSFDMWGVALVLREASPGIDDFNEGAVVCFERAAACPTGQLAIEVDGDVVTAPQINAPNFARDQISISGDFTQAEAEELAAALSGTATP